MSEPAPVPESPETAAPAAAVSTRPVPKPPVQTVVRVTPAWWVPLHAFAVLAARLAYPLALLGAATWLIRTIIQSGASAWFIVAVLVALAILLAAAPKDPEA